MKALRFSEPLPKLILTGQKNTTWRIKDEKQISPGDIVSLCYTNYKEFAKAEILSTKETTFGKLTVDDKEGHEKFSSDEEMYKTYSEYYKIQVKPNTKVKVIKFRLLK